jgi:hypothetical protein
LSGVAGGYVETAVWTEMDPPAVVDLGGGDAFDDRLLSRQIGAREPISCHLVAGAGREIQVDEAVLLEPRIDREAEQPSLPRGRDAHFG